LPSAGTLNKPITINHADARRIATNKSLLRARPSRKGSMNIQNLNRGHFSALSSGLRDRLGNVYDQIAAGDDYQRNENSLRYKTLPPFYVRFRAD
jgi:hypothetical protein